MSNSKAYDERFIGMEINKTNNLIKRDMLRSDFKKELDDATGKNGWIIGYIANNSDRDVFQRDIEDDFMIRRSTVSNMIQLMEKKGYIRREPVSYDARLKKLTLTPKAQEVHQNMVRQIEDNDRKMRQGISNEDLKTFFEVLKKIRQNLNS